MYRYLKEYHMKYGRAAKIKFNCKVENVTNTKTDKFRVTWMDTTNPDRDPITTMQSRARSQFIFVLSTRPNDFWSLDP